MPRPRKRRRVAYMPGVTYFKPAGVPLRMLEEVSLGVDELEALRLKDLAGLEQELCAREMGVSQSTFQRLLVATRSKVAEALVFGKAICIRGGPVEIGEPRPCDLAVPRSPDQTTQGPPWVAAIPPDEPGQVSGLGETRGFGRRGGRRRGNAGSPGPRP